VFCSRTKDRAASLLFPLVARLPTGLLGYADPDDVAAGAAASMGLTTFLLIEFQRGESQPPRPHPAEAL